MSAHDDVETLDPPELHQTPTGWLATGASFPRIGVTAETRDVAIHKYLVARAAWLALGTPDEGTP